MSLSLVIIWISVRITSLFHVITWSFCVFLMSSMDIRLYKSINNSLKLGNFGGREAREVKQVSYDGA